MGLQSEYQAHLSLLPSVDQRRVEELQAENAGRLAMYSQSSPLEMDPASHQASNSSLLGLQ